MRTIPKLFIVFIFSSCCNKYNWVNMTTLDNSGTINTRTFQKTILKNSPVLSAPEYDVYESLNSKHLYVKPNLVQVKTNELGHPKSFVIENRKRNSYYIFVGANDHIYNLSTKDIHSTLSPNYIIQPLNVNEFEVHLFSKPPTGLEIDYEIINLNSYYNPFDFILNITPKDKQSEKILRTLLSSNSGLNFTVDYKYYIQQVGSTLIEKSQSLNFIVNNLIH